MRRNTIWLERLLSGTRGQILRLLRRRERTVNELAAELKLTDNAVRTHLSALERDGLVEPYRSEPRGLGKPPVLYRAAAGADEVLPKGYAPVLGALLEALSARFPAEEVEAVLRDAGRRAAGGRAEGDLQARVEAAVEILGRLGGEGEVRKEGSLAIRGYSCPVAAVVPGHPEVCRLAESLVAAIVGLPVVEECERGARPHCRFRVLEGEES
jgi:predicted ArsR family transcriptional regulator